MSSVYTAPHYVSPVGWWEQSWYCLHFISNYLLVSSSPTIMGPAELPHCVRTVFAQFICLSSHSLWHLESFLHVRSHGNRKIKQQWKRTGKTLNFSFQEVSPKETLIVLLKHESSSLTLFHFQLFPLRRQAAAYLYNFVLLIVMLGLCLISPSSRICSQLCRDQWWINKHYEIWSDEYGSNGKILIM